MSDLDVKRVRLLREYGFKLAGHSLVMLGVRGFTSNQRVGGYCSDLFEACQSVVPMLCPAERDEFLRRSHSIKA